MRTTILLTLLLVLSGCATWKSPINRNSLLGEERIPSDSEIFYNGTIDAFENVSYFLQNGGRLFRLNFELTAKRQGGKVTVSFVRADFNASPPFRFQDLVRDNYFAESQENRSFDADFMRHPIDEQVLVDRLRQFHIDSASDEHSLLEGIRILLKFVALENFSRYSYVGNQTLENSQIGIFGHDFTLASSSTILDEQAGVLTVDMETRLSASYFHRYESENGDSKKTNGTYYFLAGNNRARIDYYANSLLAKDIDLALNIDGYEQAYFADTNKLYMVCPTEIQVHIKMKRIKETS